MLLTQRWPRRVAIVAVGGIWTVILYSAVARPVMLSHMAAQVGLGEGIYPNPMASIRASLRRPVPPPAGLAGYRLTRYTAAAQSASTSAIAPSFTVNFAPLPTTAPDLLTWRAYRGVTVVPIAGGHLVSGSTIDVYQIQSPPIPVPERHRLLVRISGTIERGRVCLGVLDQTKNAWLLEPADTRSEVAIDTGQNHAVSLVLVNCPQNGDNPESRFKVQSVSYAVLLNADDVRR
jgi:hypothetical protein